VEGDSLIEARDIRVRVGRKELLEGVSLAVRPGEVVAVVGPNGAGKSTLRRALCGDVDLSGGEVLMCGRALAEWTALERARVRAVMPQDSALSFPFTVLEVALMGRLPHLRGAEGRRDYEVAYEALEAVEARHLAERLYPTLSGGEKQRVQLARVLAQIWEPPTRGDGKNESDGEHKHERKGEHGHEGGHEHKRQGERFLLLDEPTSNLDLAHQHGTLAVARRFAREGVGVLVVLHDLNLAAQYGDRVLMLKDGRVAHCGRPREVLTREAIREVFGVESVVTDHPSADCPLVVPIPADTRGGSRLSAELHDLSGSPGD
jgi:iron complex transport system ATP-binding protein